VLSDVVQPSVSDLHVPASFHLATAIEEANVPYQHGGLTFLRRSSKHAFGRQSLPRTAYHRAWAVTVAKGDPKE